jgi:hypothetical protein
MSNAERVLVRQRWDGAEAAAVCPAALWDLHVRSQPGGVCGALPRGFLSGRIWCDQVAPGSLGHVCPAESRPHEMLVCILANDNPPTLMARLRAAARAPSRS